MTPPSSTRHRFEFYFSRLDTLVLVEEADGDVVVRATRDTFSEGRKEGFIHELAQEGFIPDEYRWRSVAGVDTLCGVRWLIDVSWLQLAPEAIVTARRFMLRLFLSVTVLWILLLAGLCAGPAL